MQAPPQLRVEHAFDGFTVRVSGQRPQATRWPVWVALFVGAPLLLLGAWFHSDALVGLGALALFMAYVPDSDFFGPRTEQAELRVVGRRLEIVRGAKLTRALPLVQVGRVRVHPGPELEILVAGEPSETLRMSLEPVEHAGWLARAIEGAARQARTQGGAPAEVPRGLIKLREG